VFRAHIVLCATSIRPIRALTRSALLLPSTAALKPQLSYCCYSLQGFWNHETNVFAPSNTGDAAKVLFDPSLSHLPSVSVDLLDLMLHSSAEPLSLSLLCSNGTTTVCCVAGIIISFSDLRLAGLNSVGDGLNGHSR
jgi:hypothetical protein